jgi:hypothetical protein
MLLSPRVLCADECRCPGLPQAQRQGNCNAGWEESGVQSWVLSGKLKKLRKHIDILN